MERLIQERTQDLVASLKERKDAEMVLLPFPNPSAAQAALDARNGRFRATSWFPAASAAESDGDELGSVQLLDPQRRLTERLGKAEKVAEEFVARRLQPAVQRVREMEKGGVPGE
jgi:hypothetical protein